MRSFLTVLCAIPLTAMVALAEDLKRLGLDEVSSLGLSIGADSEVKVEGTSSVRFSTLLPTTVCLAEIGELDVEDSKLVYRAQVKTELDGSAYLELWAHVDGGQYFSRGLNSTVQGQSDWSSIETPFLFQAGQKPEKVTLNLVIQGKGSVWVDDVVLSKEPLN